jgi:ribonuclease Z
MYGEPDKAQKAVEHKHMTFEEAAKLARRARPKQMWLTHYSPSLVHPEEYIDGVRKIYPAIYPGKDGKTIELDFEED